jgi:hypothetical protein
MEPDIGSKQDGVQCCERSPACSKVPAWRQGLGIARKCCRLHAVMSHLNLLRKSSRCLLPAIASFSFSLSRLHLVMYFLSASTASPLWQLLPSSVVIAYVGKHTGVFRYQTHT